jgi:sn-glycerol 3-phosphate transport system substrate-binding protein
VARAGAAVLGAAGLAKPALAQGTTEVLFFFPVAVGGPITKGLSGSK